MGIKRICFEKSKERSGLSNSLSFVIFICHISVYILPFYTTIPDILQIRSVSFSTIAKFLSNSKNLSRLWTTILLFSSLRLSCKIPLITETCKVGEYDHTPLNVYIFQLFSSLAFSRQWGVQKVTRQKFSTITL